MGTPAGEKTGGGTGLVVARWVEVCELGKNHLLILSWFSQWDKVKAQALVTKATLTPSILP